MNYNKLKIARDVLSKNQDDIANETGRTHPTTENTKAPVILRFRGVFQNRGRTGGRFLQFTPTSHRPFDG